MADGLEVECLSATIRIYIQCVGGAMANCLDFSGEWRISNEVVVWKKLDSKNMRLRECKKSKVVWVIYNISESDWQNKGRNKLDDGGRLHGWMDIFYMRWIFLGEKCRLGGGGNFKNVEGIRNLDKVRRCLPATILSATAMNKRKIPSAFIFHTLPCRADGSFFCFEARTFI